MNNQEYIQLVKASRAGDTHAASRLFEELAVRLRVIAKHKVGWWPAQEQEDLVQSTLLIFFEKLGEIKDNPCAYAVQVLANQIGSELQKKRRRQYISIVDDSVKDGMGTLGAHSLSHARDLASAARSEHEDTREEIQHIIVAIDRLKPFCRTVFKGIIQELAIAEIWEAVRRTEPGLTRSAFDKRIFDCRKQLRHVLGKPVKGRPL